MVDVHKIKYCRHKILSLHRRFYINIKQNDDIEYCRIIKFYCHRTSGETNAEAPDRGSWTRLQPQGRDVWL